jgi:hypothetical protein
MGETRGVEMFEKELEKTLLQLKRDKPEKPLFPVLD